MKAKLFTLAHDQAKGNCLAFIATLPTDGSVDVTIRNASEGKTMRQLGGLFAVWIKEIAELYTMSEAKAHEELKNKFLARIYIRDNMETTVNDNQAQWVELLAIYQMKGEQEKLERHAKRISLSWSTMKQMKEFMDNIESHFQDIGKPLQVLDPEWRKYKHA